LFVFLSAAAGAGGITAWFRRGRLELSIVAHLDEQGVGSPASDKRATYSVKTALKKQRNNFPPMTAHICLLETGLIRLN
jgi:hypothetical protein